MLPQLTALTRREMTSKLKATKSVLFWPTESDTTSASRHDHQGEIGSRQSTE
jgi:hypothetical protein